MQRIMIASAIALATSACSGTDGAGTTNDMVASHDPAAPAPDGQVSEERRYASAPATSSDMAYFYKQGEEGPALSYGEPDTDNIALSLRCPAGGTGKSLLLSFNRPREIVDQRPDTITLAAGTAREDLRIDTRSTQLGTTVEVQTSPDADPIQAFRDGAKLSLLYGDETIGIPATGDHGKIARFFAACKP
jgi:hypothetical protein